MTSSNRIRVPALPPSVETRNIISKVGEETKDKYTILTFPTHERYETNLSKTGHDFYAFRSEGLKDWNTDYADLPSNYYLLPKDSVYNGIQFDFILSQSKFGQFQTAKLLQERLGLPIVSLEHTLPTSNVKPEWLEEIRTMSGDIDVFISEFSRDAWGIQSSTTEVVHHGVDSKLFSPVDITDEPYVLSVVNDFKNRDYCCNYFGWKRITDGLETKIVGDNGELGQPAESVEKLVEEYNTAQVFLNTSTVSPVPTALLEAMSCGRAIVTTATCMIPEIVKNGENGFISNDEEELRGYVEQLLGDEELRTKLGNAARETILTDFSEKMFIDSWNNIFDAAYGV